MPVLTQKQPDATQDAATGMKQLDKLRAAGAISEAEYARKRQKIVDDI